MNYDSGVNYQDYMDQSGYQESKFVEGVTFTVCSKANGKAIDACYIYSPVGKDDKNGQLVAKIHGRKSMTQQFFAEKVNKDHVIRSMMNYNMVWTRGNIVDVKFDTEASYRIELHPYMPGNPDQLFFLDHEGFIILQNTAGGFEHYSLEDCGRTSVFEKDLGVLLRPWQRSNKHQTWELTIVQNFVQELAHFQNTCDFSYCFHNKHIKEQNKTFKNAKMPQGGNAPGQSMNRTNGQSMNRTNGQSMNRANGQDLDGSRMRPLKRSVMRPPERSDSSSSEIVMVRRPVDPRNKRPSSRQSYRGENYDYVDDPRMRNNQRNEREYRNSPYGSPSRCNDSRVYHHYVDRPSDVQVYHHDNPRHERCLETSYNFRPHRTVQYSNRNRSGSHHNHRVSKYEDDPVYFHGSHSNRNKPIIEHRGPSNSYTHHRTYHEQEPLYMHGSKYSNIQPNLNQKNIPTQYVDNHQRGQFVGNRETGRFGYLEDEQHYPRPQLHPENNTSDEFRPKRIPKVRSRSGSVTANISIDVPRSV